MVSSTSRLLRGILSFRLRQGSRGHPGSRGMLRHATEKVIIIQSREVRGNDAVSEATSLPFLQIGRSLFHARAKSHLGNCPTLCLFGASESFTASLSLPPTRRSIPMFVQKPIELFVSASFRSPQLADLSQPWDPTILLSALEVQTTLSCLFKCLPGCLPRSLHPSLVPIENASIG